MSNTINPEVMPDREPKPCPFCGGVQVSTMLYEDEGESYYYPRCIGCGASINTPSLTREDAIAKWNRRV